MIVSQQMRQVRSVRGVPRTCMKFMPHARMTIYRNDAYRGRFGLAVHRLGKKRCLEWSTLHRLLKSLSH